MNLGSALRVLLRRWLVLLLGALLTMGAAAYVYTQVPSRYQSTARMLLLLPADSRGEEAVGSPFLYLPDGLNVLAAMVALAPTSRAFRAEMSEDGFTSQYEVGVDSESPTLTISVEGTDASNVVETRDRLIEAINVELRSIQLEENAPTQQIAHTRVYAAEPMPAQIGGDRLRAVLSVGGAGALLTLILVFVIDRLSELRKARKANRPAKQSRRDRGRARAAAAGEGATVAVTAPHEPSESTDPATQVEDGNHEGAPERGAAPDQVEDADAASDQMEDADAAPDQMEDADAAPDQMEDADAAPDQMEDADAIPDQMEDADAIPDQMEEDQVGTEADDGLAESGPASPSSPSDAPHGREAAQL